MQDTYFVELFDQNYTVVAPSTLVFKVQRYSGHALGGYEQAQIKIEGTEDSLWQVVKWLGFYLFIRNEQQNIVWAGKITQAEFNIGGLQMGKSLDEMYNRIAVAYSQNDANGNATRGTALYGDNLESQARYGVKEHIDSAGDSDLVQATALRDTALIALGGPVDTPGGIGNKEIGGSLVCKGLWDTLAWKLYNQTSGVERNDVTGTVEHLLGWGLTGNKIGFFHQTGGISDLDGRLKALRVDDYIVVSGAANAPNNGTFRIAAAANMTDPKAATNAVNYTGGNIYFQPTDDVFDGNAGLAFVQPSELIRITGGQVAGNARDYFTKTDVGAGHITVYPATVVNGQITAGTAILQGHSVQTSGATFTTEYPANTITMAGLGVAVGQSFTLSVGVPFTVAEVFVRLKKVGAPADSVYVGIQADSSGSPSNTNIEAISVLGSTIGTAMGWVKFVFANTTNLVYGTPYWFVIGRTGANSPTDYYTVDVSEDATYAGGLVKLWNGSAWVARTVAADLPFQIWGHQETTAQISNILTTKGQFFAGVDIQNTSGKFPRQYRDGDQSAQTEVETMMKAGTTTGKRLLSTVTPDRIAHVFAEPDYDSNKAPLLRNDGTLTDVSGGRMEPGRLPFGQWVTVAGVPTNVDQFVGFSQRFIERCEWDAEQGKLSALEFKGAVSPWDVVHLA